MTRTLQDQRATRISKTAFQVKTIERELRKLAVRRFTVELSFPDSTLMKNRNAGRHWTFNHDAKVAQKQEAYLLTRQAITASGFEANAGARYSVTMEFCPPDKRGRDIQNLFDAMKAAIDGIADAMGINDRQFKDHRQFEGDIHARGRVVVTVEEIS